MPVGYSDGYSRHLSSIGQVLVRGQRANVLGRVCMNRIIVDVTNIEGVVRGDEVVLLGYQGQDAIFADEIAGWQETISYEILCRFGTKMPRVYIG